MSGLHHHHHFITKLSVADGGGGPLANVGSREAKSKSKVASTKMNSSHIRGAMEKMAAKSREAGTVAPKTPKGLQVGAVSLAKYQSLMKHLYAGERLLAASRGFSP